MSWTPNDQLTFDNGDLLLSLETLPDVISGGNAPKKIYELEAKLKTKNQHIRYEQLEVTAYISTEKNLIEKDYLYKIILKNSGENPPKGDDFENVAELFGKTTLDLVNESGRTIQLYFRNGEGSEAAQGKINFFLSIKYGSKTQTQSNSTLNSFGSTPVVLVTVTKPQ